MAKTSLENNGKHLSSVFARTVCHTHHAAEYEPCYIIHPSTTMGEYGALLGACGKRVKKAGFNGEISQTALMRGAPGGRSGRSTRH